MVGTEKEMSVAEIQKYFKDLIITRVKNCIAIELSKYSYNTFNRYLNEISDSVAARIENDISEYGIRILNFFVSTVSIQPDDLNELKKLDNSMAQKKFEAMGNREATVIEAQGQAKAREIQGYTWQQEQQFDISKSFAQNEGFAGNPANMMAQMPLAFSMGDMLKNNVESSVSSQQEQKFVETVQTMTVKCLNCGADVPGGAKFCFNCGEKIGVPRKIYCSECGEPMLEDAKFCINCGARRER